MERRKFYRLNYNIQAKEVRVIDDKGKQVGIMSLAAALEEAKKRGVDLVEIAPSAKPPVCRLIDFKKFRYIENKKEAEEKKKSKKVEIKEVRFSPFIAENDFNIRLEKISNFLRQNNKVRIVVKFRGRQMMKKDFGYRLIQQIIERLKTEAVIDLSPRFMGNILEAVIRPIQKNVQKTEN